MRYVIRKIITLVVTLLVISFITFMAFSVLPGDAAIVKGGINASEERIEAIREEMGLNDPLFKQYGTWLKKALKGDFGESFQYSGYSVSELIWDRLPYTIMLGIMSVVLIIVISIPLGVLAAKQKNRIIDSLITAVTHISMAVPPFFLGMILTYVFGLILKWFKPGQYVSPGESITKAVSYMIFPAVAIALPKMAMTLKYLKTSILEQMNSGYVEVIRSRGYSENQIMYRHVLKNAALPVVTFMAMVITDVLAGSIIVEQVFSIPGMGRLLVTAILNRDYPVVQAVVLYITAFVIIVNMMADMLYHILDPRIKPGIGRETR